MRKGETPTAIPENGKTYTANLEFRKGTEIAPGEFVIYNAGNNSMTVTGLDPASAYFAFEIVNELRSFIFPKWYQFDH